MNSVLTENAETTEEAVRAEVIRRFTNRDVLTDLINQAMRQAIREHKEAGNPIAGWKDGKIVMIQPEDIVVPED